MRRGFVRGLFLGAGGTAAVAVVGLLRTVLIARVMGPLTFGLWQICLVIMRLGGESHLGALHAIAVEAPILRGAARDAEARGLERRALGVTLLLGLLAGVAGAIVLRWEGGVAVGTASVLLLVAVVSQQGFHASAVVLRTRRRFGRLATLQVAFAVFHLGALLLLLPTKHLSGALAAWSGAQIAAILLVRFCTRERPARPVPAAPAATGAVIRRGIGAWLVGATFLLVMQSDRIVVAILLGPADLGQYGILLLGGTVLMMLPDVAASVLWPFAGERFGAAGRDPASLAGLAKRSLLLLTPVLAALLLLALQATDVLVALVLEPYAPSLVPLRYYLPGAYFLALSLPVRHLLVTAGAERQVIFLQVAGLVLVVAAQVALALSGAGIEGVALATGLAGLAIFAALLHLASRRLVLGRAAAAVGAVAVTLAAAALGADRLLGQLGGNPATLAGLGVRCGIPLLLVGLAGLPVLLLLTTRDEDEAESSEAA